MTGGAGAGGVGSGGDSLGGSGVATGAGAGVGAGLGARCTGAGATSNSIVTAVSSTGSFGRGQAMMIASTMPMWATTESAPPRRR